MTITGKNIATVVSVLTTMAMATALAARCSTTRRSLASVVARARNSDSAITIALSITMPEASKKPISESKLTSVPVTAIAIPAINNDKGRAVQTKMATRQRRRNSSKKINEKPAHHPAAIRIS